MKSVDAHRADVLAAVRPAPAREVGLDDALGLVLAAPVRAPAPVPGFDNSAMDGYAVRWAELAGASEDAPAALPVSGDLPAGVASLPPLAEGTVMRIMTGAPVPPGADAVVPVEWTDASMDVVRISRAPTQGQHIRRAGEDVAAGDTVLRPGVRLGSSQIGLLAAVGQATVTCHPRPRVVVLSTGSELVDVGGHLGPGQIFDSNSRALAAAAREAGAEVERVGLVHDDPDLLAATLDRALEHADALVTSGGVSVGAYDVVKQVLAGLGSIRFERVAMQPGMPQGFGLLRDVPVFTLPGNPVSALVSFEVFVRPALRTLLGHADLDRETVTAEVVEPLRSPPGKRSFLRVRLERAAGGGWRALPAGQQGSHQLSALAAANGLLVVPEDLTAVVAGSALPVMVLDAPAGDGPGARP